MASFRPVGFVRCDRPRLEETPIQALSNPVEEAVLEVLPEYSAALAGLSGFDYAWLLTHLHLHDGELGRAPTDEELRPVPFLLAGSGERQGLFATRYPVRPNPIGLILVRILDVGERSVRFAGVDVVDGTPVLDVKPWVRRFDVPPGETRHGWYDRDDQR
ncbi:MAG: SAM-dependent methyltransferase [Acidimicrobiia bacterium]